MARPALSPQTKSAILQAVQQHRAQKQAAVNGQLQAAIQTHLDQNGKPLQNPGNISGRQGGGGGGSSSGGSSSLGGNLLHAVENVGKDFGTTALKAIDMPRRAVFGTGAALGSLIRQGNFDDPRVGQAFAGTYTGADVLKDAGVKSGAAKAIGGLGLDLLGDPLTYLAPEIHAADVPNVAEKLGKAGLTDEMAAILRAKSAGAVSADALKQVGEKGGIGFLGHTVVPHDLYAAATSPLRAVRGAAGDLLDKSEVLSKFRGPSNVTAAELRSGDPERAGKALFGMRNQETSKLLGAGRAAEWAHEWQDISKDIPHESGQVIHALESQDTAALDHLAGQGVPVDRIRGWYDGIHSELKAAGADVGHIEGYVPRFVSDEMATLKTSGKSGTVSQAVSSLVKSRSIAPGSDLSWMEKGLKVPEDLKPGDVRSWVNNQAQRVYGQDFYSTDLKNLGRLYAKQAGRVLGDATWKQNLVSQGLAMPEHAYQAAQRATGSAAADVVGAMAPEAAAQHVAETAGTKQLSFDEAAHALDQASAKAPDEFNKTMLSQQADQQRQLALFDQTVGKNADKPFNPMSVSKATRDEVPTEINKLVSEQVARHPDWRFDPDIARSLNKIADLTQPRNMTEFWTNYDKVQTLIKAYQLASPGFHFRNLFSGIFNNSLADMRVGTYPKWFRAHAAWGTEGLLGDGWKSFAERFPKEADAYRQARGVASFGQIATESGDAGRQGVRGTRNILIRTNKKVGGDVEHFLRGSLAMDSLLKGESLDSAVQRVMKVHFDYADLTSAEKNLKRVIPFYCVPDDHEILTKRGWKRHHELIESEPVMALDPNTHEMRWEPLLGVATFDYDDELWTIDRRGGTFEFTPEHRWPFQVAKTVVKGKEYGGARGVKRANELNSTHMLPLTGEFVDDGDSLLSPRLAAILGWIVTDGHGRWRGNHYEAVVYQSPNKHLAAIESLLGATRRQPHPQTGVCAVPVTLVDRKAIVKHYHDKSDLPSLVPLLSREAAEAMWQAMFDAEGCTMADGEMSWSQQDGPVKDAFQILCYMTGRSAWAVPGSQQMYLRVTKFLGVKEGFGRRHYKGTIWCPQTPTGTWIMRHDGAVMPTGNTWTRRNLPLQVEMMLREPATYSHFNAFERAISKGVPSGPNVPDFLRTQGAVPTPLTEQGQRVFFNPTNTLPVGDVLDNPLDPSRYLSMVTPVLKTPLELNANKQFFKGIPLTGKLIDPPGVYKIIPGLIPALEAVGAAKNGQIRSDAAYTLDQFLPLLSKLRRNAPTATEKQFKQRQVTQLVDFLFGAGLRSNTLSTQATAANNPNG